MAKSQLDRIEGDVHLVKTWIYGNGRDGAKVRIDRLEGHWRLVRYLVGVGTLLMGVVVGAVVKLWIGRP